MLSIYQQPPMRQKGMGIMKIGLTMMTSMALLLILTGLFLAISGHDGPAGIFTMAGILGWLCGNKLSELEERLDRLESNESRPPSSAA
jgi:hypothetical protein